MSILHDFALNFLNLGHQITNSLSDNLLGFLVFKLWSQSKQKSQSLLAPVSDFLLLKRSQIFSQLCVETAGRLIALRVERIQLRLENVGIFAHMIELVFDFAELILIQYFFVAALMHRQNRICVALLTAGLALENCISDFLAEDN